MRLLAQLLLAVGTDDFLRRRVPLFFASSFSRMSILTGKVVVDKDARFNERCILPLFETGRLVRLRSIATGEAVGSFFSGQHHRAPYSLMLL